METGSNKKNLSKRLLSNNRRKYPPTSAMGKEGKNMFDFFFFSNGCRRRNSFFLVAHCQHARATIDARSRHRLSPRSTRLVTGKANEYRWRPRRYQVVYRRRELAGGVLRYPPNPEKKPSFCHWRRIENFLSSVLCTPAATCFFIVRLASARHMSPAIVWTRWP